MSNSARKQQVKATSKTSPTNKSALKQAITSIKQAHETTDRKLQEIAAYCMDKKCNE